MPCSACQRPNKTAERHNVSSNASSANTGNLNRSNNAAPATTATASSSAATTATASSSAASTIGGAFSDGASALKNSPFIDPVNNPSTKAVKNFPISMNATASTSHLSSISEESSSSSSKMEGGDQTGNVNSSFDPRDYSRGKDAASAESDKAMMGFITQLNERNFESTTREQLSFVKFFAPWCGHCARLAPIWEELARKTGDDKAVKICEIDCSQNGKVCDAQKIDGYPSMLLFKGGRKVAEYNGKWSVNDMVEFIKKNNS